VGVPRRSILQVLAIVVPIAIFLALEAYQIRLHRPADYDEHIFLDVGASILRTGLPIRSYGIAQPAPFFDHTPLYVYFVAVLTSLGKDTLTLGRVASLVFGLGTVVVVFRVARDLRGTASGLVAASLVAANPFFAELSWFLRMEVPLCFFLVLALSALVHERFFAAGLAIAVAVMLKEIALAFWLVAVVFVFVRHGWRRALIVGLPSVVAFAAWLAYAWMLDANQFAGTMSRWFNSAGGDVQVNDPRFRVARLAWLKTIADDIVGPLLLMAIAAAIAIAVERRQWLLPVTWIPLVYVLLAVGSSFLIRLKEPRYLIVVIPMAALVAGLLVDWGRVIRARGPDPETTPETNPAAATG
jgi:4-amino-4-deoxy-L-arabinose transferase-like glycosyltransferase